MEVFAKGISELNPSDFASNPTTAAVTALPNASVANAQILKDDVWFCGRQQPSQADAHFMYSPGALHENFGIVQQPLVPDQCLTDKFQHHKDCVHTENVLVGYNHNNGPPPPMRRFAGYESVLCEQPKVACPGISSINSSTTNAWPWKCASQWNTNNSSKSDRVRSPVPSGRWGHVIYNTLFDPRRTCPGYGLMYSRQPRPKQPTYRLKKEPPTFGYLDPSSMVCEYLHNYRNFLRDLRVSMRGGKNYEQVIQWGLSADFPPYLGSPVYNQYQRAPLKDHPFYFQPQQLQQQQQYTSSETSLQPLKQQQQQKRLQQDQQDSQQQLQQQARMVQQLPHQKPPPEDKERREEGQDEHQHHHHQQQQQQQQQIPDVSPGLWSVLSEISTPQSRELQIEFSRLMNTVTSTRMRKIWINNQQGAVNSHTTAGNNNNKGSLPVASETKKESGGCHTAHKSDNLVTPEEPQCRVSPETCFSSDSVLSNAGEEKSNVSKPGSQPSCANGSNQPLTHTAPNPKQTNHQSSGCAVRSCSFGESKKKHPFGSCSAVSKNQHEDEDDISSLIDSARMELQIEEEEEEEVKQQLFLSHHQHQERGITGGHVPSSSAAPTNQPLATTQPMNVEGRGERPDPPCSTSSSSVQEEKEDIMKHFRISNNSSSSQPDNASPEFNAADPKLPEAAEPERQVLFILRKSTVNHHLSLDLQQDEAATSAPLYPSFGQASAPRSWQNSPSNLTIRPDSALLGDSHRSCVDSRTPLSFSSSSCSSPSVDSGGGGGRQDKVTLVSSHPLVDDLSVSDSRPGCSRVFATDDGTQPCYNNPSFSKPMDHISQATCSGVEQHRPCSDDAGLGNLPKNSLGKIRILGSKSYSEAYTTGGGGNAQAPAAAASEDRCQQKDDWMDQALAARLKAGEGGVAGGGGAGSQKELNRKPLVVSVRPLSHAARRGSHSYLTQRPGNRHRQCQTKQHGGSRLRQDSRACCESGYEKPPERSEESTKTLSCNSSDTSGAETDGKEAAGKGSLCVTQSAHETQALREPQLLSHQDLHRRSASESDVFWDTDKKKQKSSMVIASGAGDTTTCSTSFNVISASMGSTVCSNPTMNVYASGSCISCTMTTQGDQHCFLPRENTSTSTSTFTTSSALAKSVSLSSSKNTTHQEPDSNAWITTHAPVSNNKTFSADTPALFRVCETTPQHQCKSSQQQSQCNGQQPPLPPPPALSSQVSGIFYSAPGTGKTGEGIGWKVAKPLPPPLKQSSSGWDKSNGAMKETMSYCARNNYRPTSSEDNSQGVLNVAASDGRVSDSWKTQSLHQYSAGKESSIGSSTGSVSCASALAERCSGGSAVTTSSTSTHLPESISSKPYAQVFPQGQTPTTDPPQCFPGRWCSSCEEIPPTSGKLKSRMSLTEAAFAEQIACSGAVFQSDPLNLSWDASSSAIFDKDFPAKWHSTQDASSCSGKSSSTSMFFPSFYPPHGTEPATSRLPAARLAGDGNNSPGNEEGLTEHASHDSTMFADYSPRKILSRRETSKATAEDGPSPSYNAQNLLGPGFLQTLMKPQDKAQAAGMDQFSNEWIPLSTFTLQSGSSSTCSDSRKRTTITTTTATPARESRLVQCYTNKYASSEMQSSHTGPACSENDATGSSRVMETSAVFPTETGLMMGSLEDACSGSSIAGGGAGERLAVLGDTLGSEEATSSSPDDGNKSAHKERILEEISAWFFDNSGSSQSGRKEEEADVDIRHFIPVRISHREPLNHSSNHLADEDSTRQGAAKDCTAQMLEDLDLGQLGQQGSSSSSLVHLQTSITAAPKDSPDLSGRNSSVSAAKIHGSDPTLLSSVPLSTANFENQNGVSAVTQDLISSGSRGVIGPNDKCHNLSAGLSIQSINKNLAEHSFLGRISPSCQNAANNQNLSPHSANNGQSHLVTPNVSGQNLSAKIAGAHNHAMAGQNLATHNLTGQNVIAQNVSQNVTGQTHITQNMTRENLITQNVFQNVAGGRNIAEYNVRQSSVEHSEMSNTDCSNRLFSDVARVVGQNGKHHLASAGGFSAQGKDAGSGSGTMTFPVRMDHLCNQHLIPEQFRKLIVPDMDKMMQMGRDNAWSSSAADMSSGVSSSGVYQTRAEIGENISHASSRAGSSDKNATPSPQMCAQNGADSSQATSYGSHSSQGFHITAEELFANYEAAVIGSRSHFHCAKTSSISKADNGTDDITHGSAAADLGSSTRKKHGSTSGGGYSSSSSPTPVLPSKSIVRNQSHVSKNASQVAPAAGATRGICVEQKTQQPSIFASSVAVTRESRFSPQQQQLLQQQQQQQSQQTLAFTNHNSKGREQVMTAAYYANTRLNDVMTYASINIPGLPRIPILSPQVAAQNAFMMKANTMRPCLQPNLSVPPPGFIPLMPVPTGPAFHHHHHHHGAGGYPMGPTVFQPGVFHSPNFITMTPHHHHPAAAAAAPTFLQQTKVNICANVNINSSVSATFNINGSNNRNNDNNNSNPLPPPILAPTGFSLRAPTPSSSSPSLASITSSNPQEPGRKGVAENRGSTGKSSGWSPLMVVNATTSGKSVPGGKASGAGGGDLVLSDKLMSAGKGNPTQAGTDPDLKASTSGHQSNSEDGWVKDDMSRRSEMDRGRGGGGGVHIGETAAPTASSNLTPVVRPRGSNMDNLIHVFPPRP